MSAEPILMPFSGYRATKSTTTATCSSSAPKTLRPPAPQPHLRRVRPS